MWVCVQTHSSSLVRSSRPVLLLRDSPYVHGPISDLRKKNVILELKKTLGIMFPEFPFARRANRPRELKAWCSEIRAAPASCPLICPFSIFSISLYSLHSVKIVFRYMKYCFELNIFSSLSNATWASILIMITYGSKFECMFTDFKDN